MSHILITGSRAKHWTPDTRHDAIAKLGHIVRKAKLARCEQLIVGDANGIDTWLLELARDYRMPTQVFGVQPRPRRAAQEVISMTRFISYVQVHNVPQGTKRGYTMRDEYMVDLLTNLSAQPRVYALWNGASPGTKATVEYALKRGIERVFVWCPAFPGNGWRKGSEVFG